jgi:hypothetical protein
MIRVALLAVVLSGCSMIPSFYDDNESSISIDLRYSVNQLDCSKPHGVQVKEIDKSLKYLELYTESKGSDDVAKMISPMRGTVDDFIKRGDDGSVVYCNLKKKFMETQSAEIAETIMGRF